MPEGTLVTRSAILLENREGCEMIGLDRAVEQICSGGRPVWLDIIAADRAKARELLQDRLKFHELAVEDALSSEERPALQQFDDTVFFVIPSVSEQDNDEKYVEVGFFLRKGAVVTVSLEPVPVVQQWFDRWLQHPAEVGPDAPTLVHSLVDALVDGYFPVADAIEDEVDDISDVIFAGDTSQVPRLLRTKRRLLEMRRRLGPTRDVLNSLLRRDLTAIPNEIRPYLQDVLDHVLRVSDLVDMNRDTLASMLDVHLSTVSNNVNVILKKMTVLSTVLMTMALVAGIYGMNFEHMPELKWVEGYPFALAMMFILSALEVAIFKLVKWL